MKKSANKIGQIEGLKSQAKIHDIYEIMNIYTSMLATEEMMKLETTYWRELNETLTKKFKKASAKLKKNPTITPNEMVTYLLGRKKV